MSVRKFLFDESFDVDAVPRMTHAGDDDFLPEPEIQPEPEPELPPPPPAPTFGEAELAAARAQGHAEGFAAGKSEGTSAGYGKGFGDGMVSGQTTGYDRAKAEIEATVNARIANALDQLGNGVAHLLAQSEAANAMRGDQPVHLALAIVRKLMPEWARRGGMVEVEGMVRACLTDLIDEPRLIVRVADGTMDLVREHLDAVVASRGFGAKLMVVGDPTIAPGGCRIEWADGGMERDTAQLMSEIEQRAARLLEAPSAV
ncbi:FliH/SctL family protein [Azospirillum doebereinerae]|uniref:Flagellar assembly protein FliH n=1 Tax=Azospirillum doebereinerae TaxID=92933 RepID=A0A3S0V3Y5_9PROT|nr:FliH/SctL family protein [Azospirillum doebereinerae]MCG5243483.1 flagellar assembly protein FliH [Azospirillum doebereinerae]RUQ66220.1 flagellar assembly protein FliH [Azospirillum doebereinerae]